MNYIEGGSYLTIYDELDQEKFDEAMNEEKILSIIVNHLDNIFEEYISKKQLPLVLINDDLKELFQISDSTLNRLIKLTDFPSCWYGIRGHYLRDDILEWLENKDYTQFIEEMRLLRLL